MSFVNEVFQAVGVLTVTIVGGAWVMRYFDDKKREKVRQELAAGLLARRAQFPHEAPKIDEELQKLNDFMARNRSRLF